MKANKTSEITTGCQKRKRRYHITILALFVAVFSLAALMMIYGNTIYSLNVIIRVLLGEQIKGATFTIYTLRLPRMLSAVLCGFAFGLAGNTFQMLLKNPLASPDIIGVTSGASAAAVLGILFLGFNQNEVSLLAVASGILVSCLIYFLSGGEGFHGKLILTGIGIQAFLNATISWMLLKASEYDVSSALRWLNGSLNAVNLEQIKGLFVAVFLSGGIILFLSRHLMVLQLGDSYAIPLGMNLTLIRLMLIVCSIVLIAFSASVTGPIASVAFLSGPIAQRLSGGGRSNLVPSALTGAILVLAGDLVGQFALPARYPAGVITGILGAPYLLYLLYRTNQKGERIT